MMFINRGSMGGPFRDWIFPYPLLDGDQEIIRDMPKEDIDNPVVESSTQQVAIMFGQPQKLERLKERLHSISHFAGRMEMRIRGDTLEVGFNTNTRGSTKLPWDMVETAIVSSFCLEIHKVSDIPR